MTIEINGMAHVILTVSRFEVAREFYRKLLPEFGMKPVFDGDKLFYCVGARTAIGIEPCEPALAGERFVQQRVGLHHLCLRARSREDVDRCAALLKEMNATIVRGPQEGTWAPGYYYVLFEDPDGIRLEVNFVPGAGLLADRDSVQPCYRLRLRLRTRLAVSGPLLTTATARRSPSRGAGVSLPTRFRSSQQICAASAAAPPTTRPPCRSIEKQTSLAAGNTPSKPSLFPDGYNSVGKSLFTASSGHAGGQPIQLHRASPI